MLQPPLFTMMLSSIPAPFYLAVLRIIPKPIVALMQRLAGRL